MFLAVLEPSGSGVVLDLVDWDSSDLEAALDDVQDYLDEYHLSRSDLIYSIDSEDEDLDWSTVLDWSLSEKEELTTLVAQYPEEAVYYYLKNQHFNHAALGSFQDAYQGKHLSDEQYAMDSFREAYSELFCVMDVAGLTESILDVSYITKQSSHYSFEASDGEVYVFANI